MNTPKSPDVTPVVPVMPVTKPSTPAPPLPREAFAPAQPEVKPEPAKKAAPEFKLRGLA
jgi:hypothetical protein